MKNKIIAALLAFFLGSFGAHQFYLGNNGKGILYVLFCWTLIPSLIAFVEFILFLTMSEEAFNEKYNSGQPAKTDIHYTEELVRLNELRKMGVITEAEYNEKKASILRETR